MQTEFLLVLTTCPDTEQANALAKALVQAGVAACVQISPGLTSVYHWQGELCESREAGLQIKCAAGRYAELERLVLELHPYQVPELIALPVSHGLPAYLDWIKETTLR
ncbi:divalent-cation tolerance protein CutA [Shewanella sp. AS16]|uniref:divalent-cation tolerance protein CutA n=1 Tax=Shewanella sp. AS16 TaxID=2907625 RepID=UPI001F164FC3|nr:divalent-cation tolerance protein CutA [Shewanella sp. AS16]MCE9687610.1 divalent-cation tolerance protein CutA [Shewanella sp. AS16]